MARLYDTDGTAHGMEPAEGHTFELEELQLAVQGPIEMVWLPKDGQWLVVNEEGRLKGLPRNAQAEEIWVRNFPDGLGVNDGAVVGRAVVCSPTEAGDQSRGLDALAYELEAILEQEEADMDALWDLLPRLAEALKAEGYGTDVEA